MELRPTRGGFARPFGAGWFIREYLLGNGPEGSTRIEPGRGAPQSDINYEYKVSLSTATARTRAEKRISNLVLIGVGKRRTRRCRTIILRLRTGSTTG